MFRTKGGATVGAVICPTAQAGYGAWRGPAAGVGWSHPLPPPGWGAAVNAAAMLADFWRAVGSARPAGSGEGSSGLGRGLPPPGRKIGWTPRHPRDPR